MADQDNTPLGNLLGGIGFFAGCAIGWNSSQNAITAIVLGLILAGVGVIVGNVAWQLLIVVVSIVILIVQVNVRREVAEAVVSAVQERPAVQESQPVVSDTLVPRVAIPDTIPEGRIVHIENPTGVPVPISIAISLSQPQSRGAFTHYTIAPGDTLSYWNPLANIFVLRFDSMGGDDIITPREYTHKCSGSLVSDNRYVFKFKIGNELELYLNK